MTTAWAEDTATWKTPWVKPGGDFIKPAVGEHTVTRRWSANGS